VQLSCIQSQPRSIASLRPAKKATGQKKMLLPIDGNKPAKEGAAKKARVRLRHRRNAYFSLEAGFA
jgi:hypothetical protein